jgi:hypothetical protein
LAGFATDRNQGKPPIKEDKFPTGDTAENNFSGKSSPFIFFSLVAAATY